MRKDVIKVSSSRINTFRNCHYAHYLKYYRSIEKKVKGSALRRGSIIHECIEAYHSGKSWVKVLNKFSKDFYKNTFQEEIADKGDIPEMAKEILENYFYYYHNEPYEYLYNEYHFKLPLCKGVIIEGYIDAVVRDNNTGDVIPKETKTYTRSPDRDFLMFNSQSAIYLWALEQDNIFSDATLWDIIKAKKPTKPKMTEKTKKLSLAKLDSTPYTVTRGIMELDLNPEDYKEFINGHSFEDYFNRQYIRINKKVVKLIMDDTIDTAKEIRNRGPELRDRNLSKNCAWCQYKEICQAELMNLDTDYIMSHEYKPRKGGKNEKSKKD